MKLNAINFLMPKVQLIFLLAIGSLAPQLLMAQQVYRIVGPDGRVTFSDRSPPSANAGKAVGGNTGGAPGNAASARLPFELQQVTVKYPVVLYTGDNCAPCAAGRAMLTSRGIPFNEKMVTTAADTDALQRLSGGSSLPFLTIGSQQLNGFSDVEWTEFLNAAGYPKSSVLPSSYRAPAPAPLVASAASPAGQTVPANVIKPVPAARPVPPPVNNTNPSGIRF